MKTISVRQMASIKRVAQNVNYAVTKKNRLAGKIEELNLEYNDLMREIEVHEMGVKALTGFTSEELIKKTITTTDKVDKDGNPIKVTKYEPNEYCTFNEDTRLWEVNLPEMVESVNMEEIDGNAVAPEREEIPTEGFNPITFGE